ncbi:MAG: hypothetical protein E7284_10510 [Lachnospiraceae bacterium]|nr:hypothetical protein [Lachnospiraceae bacterium]
MKKVIIIGAGPAGITAGYELLKQSNEYEVTILEETPYIGGISRTEVYNGHRMDIGGHRFFSKSQEVNDWWEKIMPMQGAPAYDDDKLGRDVPLAKGGPNPEKEERVMLNRSRVSHIYYNRKFFEYPVKMNMNTFKNMGFGTTMQAGFSYLGSMVAKKPESSLENFYINQFGKKLYSMFFEGYTEKLWGRHPREIDPSWGAQRTKGLSITEIVKDATRKVFHKENKEVNTSLIEAFKYPKLGPGQLWEAAAADFEAMGGSIHTNCRVIRINTDGNMVESVTCAVDGITIEEKADIVISSMPIKDLIIGMTNVPPNVTEVARKLPYRDFVTVGLLVPKLRINNTTYVKTLGNVIPDTWIYVQDTGVKMGRIQIFNNWSPYLLVNPEKTVWVGLEYFCNEGDRYWNMTDEEWVQFATKELIQMGILSESAKILDSHKVAVKKAYPAYFDTYSRFEEVRTYLDGYDNLYCVGRNGQHRYNNMDHSMITAFETVKNILGGVKDKSNIWNVNTEKEYHEEKVIKKESTENSVKKAEDVIVTQSESSVAEEKTTVTATPVPPVKQVQEKEEAVKEEELKAMVQEVPAPPVRKQIRRNPKVEQTVAEEKVIPSETVEDVVSKETDAEPVKEQTVIETETVVPEAEIHVSKSRSIWDDVAIAEAEAPVKTAPIVVKPAVMEEAIEKTVTEVKEEVLPAESKAEPVAETDAIKEETVAEVTNAAEEKKPKRTRRKKAEVAEEKVEEKDSSNVEVTSEEKPVVEAEQATVEEKKTTRTRRKKSTSAVEVKEEKIAVTVEEVKEESVAEVVEEIKEEPVAEVIEEVKEESVTEIVEENKEEPVTEVEEKIKEEPVVEAVKEITEDSEPETEKPKRTKRKVKEEKKEEVAEKKAEEAVKTDETAKEEKTVSRSASGKTIAGRTASHRASSNRKVSSRTKAEASEKKVSNIGKEAVVGNMKGTVIKANVIQKTPEDEKKSSNGRSGRR